MQSSQHKTKNSLRNLAQNSKQGLKQTPLVSIIVPIYNVANYLKECLQSIVAQSYENLDIILIDDGSDDESLKIALNFAENDKRIFVISKPNGGLSSARNFGLEFIKGSALREFCQKQDFSPTAQNDKNQTCHTERSEVSQNDKEIAVRYNKSLDFKKWQLIIVGDGVLKKELESKIKALNLQESVILKPFTKQIEKEYLSASIYAMTSHFEGFGMVLAEASSYALPCIAFDIATGPSDIIENEKSGFLVEDNDLQGYADKLMLLMRDENLRFNFGTKAKRVVSEKFSKEVVMKEWQGLFDELCGG